jgi:hypothetical protein
MDEMIDGPLRMRLVWPTMGVSHDFGTIEQFNSAL